MYELAKHHSVQQKVYEEIVNVLQNHDGKLTYESLSEMKYLDKCIDGKIFKIFLLVRFMIFVFEKFY